MESYAQVAIPYGLTFGWRGEDVFCWRSRVRSRGEVTRHLELVHNERDSHGVPVAKVIPYSPWARTFAASERIASALNTRWPPKWERLHRQPLTWAIRREPEMSIRVPPSISANVGVYVGIVCVLGC